MLKTYLNHLAKQIGLALGGATPAPSQVLVPVPVAQRTSTQDMLRQPRVARRTNQDL